VPAALKERGPSPPADVRKFFNSPTPDVAAYGATYRLVAILTVHRHSRVPLLERNQVRELVLIESIGIFYD